MTGRASAIRPAVRGDIGSMRSIERAAGEAFRDVGLDIIADDEPLTAEELVGWIDADCAWVAIVAECVVGYVLVEVVDDHAHIAQVSVDPRHQGAGLGRALLDAVALWARAQQCVGLSLTTFRDVPWNAPLYRHLGFAVIASDDLTPGLTAVMAHETALGLDVAPRVAMRRDL